MSQKNKILEYLKSGKFISPIEALNLFGCFRLGARINELRQAGNNIKTMINRDGPRYAKYYLIAPGVRRVF